MKDSRPEGQRHGAQGDPATPLGGHETPLASGEGFIIRPAEGEDEINYVKKTWLLRAAEDSWPAAEFMYGPSFMHEHHALIEACLDRAAITIAYRPSMPTRVCGFAVVEHRPDADGAEGRRVIHFVFVRARWRRMGVAKLLLRPWIVKPALYTHRTLSLQTLHVRVPEAWTYNPYPFLRTA